MTPPELPSYVIEYRDIKTMHMGSIVLYRMGDFYEAFDDDAKTVADVLNIALTKRGSVPMSGFPVMNADHYRHHLEKAGFSVVTYCRGKIQE